MLVVENQPVEVEFAFQAPQALEVFVTGDFNNWRLHDLRLRKDAAGFWRVEVWLAPGRYEYRFIVDGQWQKDSRAATWVANDFGYSNGVLEIN
jgi:1,4-alpha-glucan branching enzyme